MNVISNEESDESPGATVRPIIIPKIPVPKNIIIRTFSLNGLMYFIYRLCTKNQHYKWNDKSGQFNPKMKKSQNQTSGNILNHPNFHFTTCQCSSAWLEHSPCKRKVMGSDPVIGFPFVLIFKKCGQRIKYT